ncbi:hypothetical protein acsn021_11270 [Anaerocolumna cellulosilytica]|uniref:Uncharacterized protein n=1 Tax=Anaerocolumna cellulosilytica TaxID=433286 RepID=A0A6S6R3D7_9FIRM|nr:single-stranded DNA-binding protein [Anaerocolumna cellulosilytica]MBB5194614.1 single-strand DNA-binding protein [Anaerocolumna cellulosilytica]BCJ93558.1 hypothetical protein acsn021_11270 [Anaerocolumna cellulosilytica]
MNKFIIMARLCRNPEVWETKGETPLLMASFSIAYNWPKKDGKEEADYYYCLATGKLAEFIKNYVKSGNKVLVTGKLKNNNYQNKNGDKVFGVQVYVDEIELVESKRNRTKEQAQEVRLPSDLE